MTNEHDLLFDKSSIKFVKWNWINKLKVKLFKRYELVRVCSFYKERVDEVYGWHNKKTGNYIITKMNSRKGKH